MFELEMFCQKLFGLCGIILIGHHIVGVADIPGWQRTVFRFGHVFAQIVNDLFPADGVTQGLANFDVIQR